MTRREAKLFKRFRKHFIRYGLLLCEGGYPAKAILYHGRATKPTGEKIVISFDALSWTMLFDDMKRVVRRRKPNWRMDDLILSEAAENQPTAGEKPDQKGVA